jgi:2-hydroxychromene-2-carboxylate isomerase
MRLCTVASPALRPAVTAALYRAYWTEGRDLSDPAVVDEIALQHGIPKDSIRAPETKQALRERTAAAVERGVFGVPSLQVFRDGEAVGPVHWGSDRLHFVEQELAGARVDPSPPAAAGAPRSRITLFHDFASPYAYLGVSQAARIAEKHGAELVLAPILLGALFRQIGTPIVPLFAMNPAKQQWYSAELGRWAAWWGVDFAFPSCFPVRTVAPLRAALVEPTLTLPLYRALWVDGKNIGEHDVLAEVITAAGHDPEAILAQTQRPELKAQLKHNTARAEQLGVVGVPSYLVERTGTSKDPEATPPVLIWGQDRTVQLERVLQGWTPAGEGR